MLQTISSLHDFQSNILSTFSPSLCMLRVSPTAYQCHSGHRHSQAGSGSCLGRHTHRSHSHCTPVCSVCLSGPAHVRHSMCPPLCPASPSETHRPVIILQRGPVQGKSSYFTLKIGAATFRMYGITSRKPPVLLISAKNIVIPHSYVKFKNIFNIFNPYTSRVFFFPNDLSR